MAANHPCTILRYQKSMLGVEMTKLSGNCIQILNRRTLFGLTVIHEFRRREHFFQGCATHGKSAVIVDQS